MKMMVKNNSYECASRGGHRLLVLKAGFDSPPPGSPAIRAGRGEEISALS